MKIYLYGKIMHVNTNYLILDHNGEGELIYVPNISRFEKDQVKKIFISNVTNEYTNTTYGFDCFKEMVIFEDLIALQGLGPKTAIAILNLGWENVLNYIATEDCNSLMKVSYVSQRIANNIIYNYKEKYQKFLSKLSEDEISKFKNKISESNAQSQFEETMKMLGFKSQQIKYALENMKLTENIEECVENAIKIIGSKANEARI
ncbi:Holliday junction branch migration protein RuvA [Metamycoplasma equirhinis]|uniref:Holliday junction branch migration complex subunit RuvA n=1 Tax=Metamycoplasma equirhinis TaxID=92402 RepID=A0ABZ0PA50_9BACT|nr:Holliday junction branch migration protein RuvA [Metamycoplasma equirhinis]TPD98735.1 Holliday junction branch migration protein RuvA [Metamycoplasma equirhinis]WPB53711.1 Holliday junction branch migration protein RuvA [Metamycoplasma equirhinis]BDX52721.1 Holliday junction ATP-dependent DNA helicase RuvA [Metamycoplasma equirhinis]